MQSIVWTLTLSMERNTVVFELRLTLENFDKFEWKKKNSFHFHEKWDMIAQRETTTKNAEFYRNCIALHDILLRFTMSACVDLFAKHMREFFFF